MALRIRIDKGLDIPIPGSPEQVIFTGRSVKSVALLGTDYSGLNPRLLIEPGQSINQGEALFVDKHDARVQYTAPGTGRVVAVNRGHRRVLQSVIIELDEAAESKKIFNSLQLQDRSAIRDLLLQSGSWTAFRTRPFDRVPLSDTSPSAIFVTAIDTRPLAVDPEVIVAKRSEEFIRGIELVAALTDGTTFLCTGPDWSGPEPETKGIQKVEFIGPHPAGLPSTHIHYLQPVSAQRTVWHINYQDVIAIGYLALTGRLLNERLISIAGPGLLKPRLIRTRLGASISDLLEGELVTTQNCQPLSGSVLDGFAAVESSAFLGRYHNQVSVLFDSAQSYRLSERAVGSKKLSITELLGAAWKRQSSHEITNGCSGRRVAMVPVEAFERVMPLDILPAPLLRALLIKDTDAAQALGCLELAEDDLALCSFVCPAKQDYAAALRANLDQIEMEG